MCIPREHDISEARPNVDAEILVPGFLKVLLCVCSSATLPLSWERGGRLR
jgi:hypothetical protein